MSGNVKQSSPEVAWKAALDELQLQMTRATFNTWLKDATLKRVELHGGGLRYTIGVRNDYAKDWLENRLNDNVARTLGAITGEKVTIDYRVVTDMPEPPPNFDPSVNGSAIGGNVPDEVRQEARQRTRRRTTPRKRGGSNDSGAGNNPIRYRKIRPPTDPLGSFVKTSHYAIRFWRPYLGADLFDLLQIISSYAYEFEVLGKPGPTIKTLVRKLGRGDKSKLVGRAPAKSNPEKYPGTPGLLNELRDHDLCHHHSKGRGRGQEQFFDYLTKIEDLPLLTPKQVATLSQEDQSEHEEWMRLHTAVEYDEWLTDDRVTAVMAIPLEEYA